MGNKNSQSTALGHSTENVMPPPPPTERSKSRRNKFLNVFTVQGVGKALSFGRKRTSAAAAAGDVLQAHQPPTLDPTAAAPSPGGNKGKTQTPTPLTEAQSFEPLDFSEISKSYSVDWSKDGVLGQGHYATVYRGKGTQSQIPVAVKKVAKRLTRMDALKTEVDALRKVSGHANIVNLYDVYLDTDHMYLVLELLAGGELFDRVVQSGAYSERDAQIHMKAIGSALQHMHSRGIVHRDLKPENLVLENPSPDSPIKISDFGLSKILKDDEEVMMTICGTKAYSAPEVGFGFRQAGIPRNDSGYSAKVDMWSLGVILYVIVAAYHPFDPHGVDNDQTIWSRIVAGTWDFKDRVWDALSPSLKDLIEKLIELDVDKRLSAEEFLKHPWINDASTPVRPLPSLTRVRSSRYWHVPQTPGASGIGSGMAGAAHATARPIAEVGSSEEDNSASLRDMNATTSSAATLAAVDNDHNLV